MDHLEGMQIMCRRTKDDFEALTLANIITSHGGDVFSITNTKDSDYYPWSVWARIHADTIDQVDRAYGKWINTLYSGSAD